MSGEPNLEHLQREARALIANSGREREELLERLARSVRPSRPLLEAALARAEAQMNCAQDRVRKLREQLRRSGRT